MARFWADVRHRTVGQATPDPGGQGNPARVDDRGRDVAEQAATAARSASVAATAERLRRTGAVGHLRARLAGRPGASALSGADDRRCHQLELGALRRARCNAAQHGRVVGIPGDERPHGGCLHGSRFDVHRAAAPRREPRATARGGPDDAVRAGAAGVGNRFDPGLFAPSERPHRTQLLDSRRTAW